MTYPHLPWSIRRFARLLPAALVVAVCLNYCPHNLQAADTPPNEAVAPAAPAPAAVAPATAAPAAEKNEPAAPAASAPAPAAPAATAPARPTKLLRPRGRQPGPLPKNRR